MKVLILTYYWPPAGGSGVQRWLKFVKYLQHFGVTPVVYTVDHPEYALVDNTLQNDVPGNIEVLKHPIWEPNNLLSKFKSKEKLISAGFLNPNPSFVLKKLRYIRANYFIPDSRKYWVKPSVKYLSNYLKNNPVDAIITTGPPHSLHLIGMKLKSKLGIKWISDFRDPWTDIDYFHQLPLTDRAKQKHQLLEKKVLNNSDVVIVVGNTMKENYKTYNKNIHVITNGFDSVSRNETISLHQKFTLTHIGMMNSDRNPYILWSVLKDLIQENSDFKENLQIKLIGKVSDEVRNSLMENNLTEITQFISYLPHHKVLYHQRSSQVLILAVNKVPSAKGIITGKIFEYLQAKRPILAIAPENGDLSEIIGKTKSGSVVDFDNKVKLKEVILDLFKNYKQGSLTIDSVNIDQYHRKFLTEKLVNLIESTVKK